jgi:hypothetical protein
MFARSLYRQVFSNSDTNGDDVIDGSEEEEEEEVVSTGSQIMLKMHFQPSFFSMFNFSNFVLLHVMCRVLKCTACTQIQDDPACMITSTLHSLHFSGKCLYMIYLTFYVIIS